MELTYKSAKAEDIEPVYALCKALIEKYEQPETVDLSKVLRWVRHKIETSIGEYTVVCADGRKAGYYHFYKNEDGMFELDDLYVFPEFQGRGIGSAVIQKCCGSVQTPVMLYVFIRNARAVDLYKRMGFEVTETIKDSRYIMRCEK